MELATHWCFLISPPCWRVQLGSATAQRPQVSNPQQCLTCPQETKQSPSGEEEEGRLLPPRLPSLAGGHQSQPWACPVAGPVLAVQKQRPLSCRGVGARAHLPPWWGSPCAAPQKDRVGRMLPPAKSPSDSCLASFERR